MTHLRMRRRLAIYESVPEMLRPGNHLLQPLPNDDAEALWPHLQSVELIREAILIEAGAPVTHLYLPESGIVWTTARLSRRLLHARDPCNYETLPLTQELLARLMGVQRNSISIVAHGFQQAGIISYNRGRIDIDDHESLEATSCQCYRVVKARRDRLLKAIDGWRHGDR
jgi:hypothetical protein